MISQNEIEKLAELKEFADEHKRLNEAIKARLKAGEREEAGGWQLNANYTPKRNVSWKNVVIRIKSKGYADNVLHNTKAIPVLSVKPAFSIAAEKQAKKTA